MLKKFLIIGIIYFFSTHSAFSAPIDDFPLHLKTLSRTEAKQLPPDFKLPTIHGTFLSWSCSSYNFRAHCIASGYTSGKGNDSKKNVPLVMSSVNGGVTWIEHSIADLPPDIEWNPDISCALDLSICIATGYDPHGKNLLAIAQSTDNMHTWVVKRFDVTQACGFLGDNSCQFKIQTCSGEGDHTICVAAAEMDDWLHYHYIIQTRDHGKTWTEVSAYLCGRILSGACKLCGSSCAPSEVYCSISAYCGDLPDHRYSTIYTRDTGKTWHSID